MSVQLTRFYHFVIQLHIWGWILSWLILHLLPPPRCAQLHTVFLLQCIQMPWQISVCWAQCGGGSKINVVLIMIKFALTYVVGWQNDKIWLTVLTCKLINERYSAATFCTYNMHTHAHAHTLTQPHTPLYTNTSKDCLEKWEKQHLVLSKTNGSTVNLGTITTRKKRKKSSTARIQVVIKWAALCT